MESLLETLYFACLKANNLAVACRQKPELLALLTQEKGEGEKNEKFDQDFKTLADVLIQEVVRFEISKLSDKLGSQIHGEESNTFTNSLNETVTLELNSSQDNTRQLLESVLNGDKEVAESLAIEAHKPFQVPQIIKDQFQALENPETDVTKFGVWIDPIDGTSQYIKGVEKLDENVYPLKGLKVAKVLIGVYDIDTGYPVIGLVGSPFTETNQIIIGGCSPTSFVLPTILKETQVEKRKKPKIVIGSSENLDLLVKLKTDFEIIQAGGAGHKIVMVIEGVVDLYFNSTPSVFYWDTCGPHAILKSLGGDIVTFKGYKEILYNDAKDKSGAAHTDGIVAYKDTQILELFKSKLV